MKPSPEQIRIARLLQLHPDMPHTWPMDLINQLIGIETNKGGEALFREVQALLSHLTF